MSLRERRIQNEWNFLLRLLKENPDVMGSAAHSTAVGGDWFRFTLHRTGALTLSAPVAIVTTHRMKFHFPEFFPAVPIEAYLEVPVRHPNVDKESGFICLWEKTSAGDSIVDAVRQLQRVLTWELFNRSADHLMQPDTLDPLPTGIPLAYEAIGVPEDLDAARHYRRAPQTFRKRLSNP